MKVSCFTRIIRLFMVLVLALPLPNTAWGANPHDKSADGMISTMTVLSNLSRSEKEADVALYFQREDVRAELIKKGLSFEEVSSRIASLSDLELQTLATQVQEARAGGDVFVTVLLILLIVFVAKRI